jgi:polyhydroxyalkanoate synthesis regulator phasin
MNETRVRKYPDTLHITTKDSHTLTNGPTIYIAEDVEKISNYCLKDSNIPSVVLDKIMTDIRKNNSISKQIKSIESRIEDKTMSDIISGHDKKLTNQRGDPEVTELRDKLRKLTNEIRSIKLPAKYIPNTYDHMLRYLGDVNKDSFTCEISDEVTEKIMLMNDVDNKWKLLLLMGIGVFTNFKNTTYMDVMKELALHEKLYLIIAGQDFIYGTNYQFCQGYISNDLSHMTQEKLIQAIGRVGRNKISHVYSIRFRNMDTINKLFTNDVYQPEILKMGQLFNSITV